MMGEYVIPAILGYGRVFTMGNSLVLRFMEARNWPSGSAQAVALMIVMFLTRHLLRLVHQQRQPHAAT